MIRGLDVSHYQGRVNWAALKAQYNLSFGAAKASEGTGFTDSQFAWNWAAMKSAGLRRIAYHFARPEASSALVQATRFVNIVKPKPGDALCLDLEASQLSQGATNAWMRAFGAALRDLAPGVVTIAYLGGYAANGSGQAAVTAFDRWWYPRYPGITYWPATFEPRVSGNTTGFKVPPAPHIWQFTPDMAGRDADVSNLTVSELFAIPTTAPPVHDQGAPEMFVLQKTGDPAIYISDGLTRRHLPNAAAFDALVHAGAVSSSPVPCTSDQMLDDVGGPIAVDPLTPAVIAAAVMAALPPADGGAGFTAAQLTQVEQAVARVLTGGTAQVPA